VDLIDKRFSIISHFVDIGQFGDTLTHMKQWTSAEYKNMVMVCLPALAPLPEGHPDHIKFIKSVTDFILIATYHSHTETKLKYLQDMLCVISNSIHQFLPYRIIHSMSKIPTIHSLLHNIECIREMNATDINYSKMSEAAQEYPVKDS